MKTGATVTIPYEEYSNLLKFREAIENGRKAYIYCSYRDDYDIGFLYSNEQVIDLLVSENNKLADKIVELSAKLKKNENISIWDLVRKRK